VAPACRRPRSPGVRSVLHHQGPGQGLGLGLSISYNIIRDFDGTLSVANHPEGGAVFTVTLRRRRAPEPDAADRGLAAE
jgi:signal transduction histidine kinase